jgi:hypothetical protein
MEGIGISYGDSGHFRSFNFGVAPEKRETWGFVALRPYDVGPSSLGTLNEVSDRVTAIKQLTGDEAGETLGEF